MAIRKINEVQKVVLVKTQASKGGGKGSVNQPIPKDVKIESLGSDEEAEEEQKDDSGKDQQGDKGEKQESTEGQEKQEGSDGESSESGDKGQESEGESGEGEGQGKGSGKDGAQKDIEQIQKQAEELLNKIKGVDEQH